MVKELTMRKSDVIRVVVADDHAVVREGLRSLITQQGDMEIAGVASDGAAVLEMCRSVQPDILLLDLSMPVMDGHTIAARLKTICPKTRVIVLTVHDGDEDIYRALRAGVAGYVLKSASSEELLSAIRAVYSGRRFLSPAAGASLADRLSLDPPTARELEILQHVAEGKTNKQIASAIGLSARTIKGYLDQIFRKLGVTDRTEAVVVAVRRGFIRLKNY